MHRINSLQPLFAPASSGEEEFSLLPAQGEASFAAVLRLRREIYCEAGKVAPPEGYHSPLDQSGEAFLVQRGGKVIGTFSLHRHRAGGATEDLMSFYRASAGLAPTSEVRGIFVYFLGLRREERKAAALKFIFAEIFKYLVRHRLEHIFLLADARLARKYRWIGFKPTGYQSQGSFPKSGALALMHTRQIRCGVYGLHADPVRWNVYLRDAIVSLRAEGEIATDGLDGLVYRIYSLFSGCARLYERLMVYALRSRREIAPTKVPTYVR